MLPQLQLSPAGLKQVAPHPDRSALNHEAFPPEVFPLRLWSPLEAALKQALSPGGFLHTPEPPQEFRETQADAVKGQGVSSLAVLDLE